MTPVISPWVFYVMPLCEKLSFISTLGAACIGMAVIFLSVGYFCDIDWNRTSDAEIKKRCIKKLIPFLIITALISCLLPTEETVTKMLIAQNVTYERVDVVTDTVANVYNDIMNLFRDSGAANG